MDINRISKADKMASRTARMWDITIKKDMGRINEVSESVGNEITSRDSSRTNKVDGMSFRTSEITTLRT